jgi:hypothetical protein
MPCSSSDGMSSSGHDYEAHRKLERLTRVSCEIMAALEKIGLTPEQFGPEVRSWWTEHRAVDARREAAARALAEREKLRAAGLAKLTPEERKALGL